MKIAMILVSGALVLVPGVTLAQSASGPTPNKPGRTEAAKVPHSSGAAATDSGTANDRAIDAEMRRIDRMMSICNGC